MKSTISRSTWMKKAHKEAAAQIAARIEIIARRRNRAALVAASGSKEVVEIPAPANYAAELGRAMSKLAKRYRVVNNLTSADETRNEAIRRDKENAADKITKFYTRNARRFAAAHLTD